MASERGAVLAAGHGSQSPDYTGDESDGMNETICPCDFQTVRCDHGETKQQHTVSMVHSGGTGAAVSRMLPCKL